MIKALPMLRGFTNIFRIEYAEVNLDRLSRFSEGSRVTPAELKGAGTITSRKKPVEVLGPRGLKLPLPVAAPRLARSARTAIEAAGGTVEEL